MAALSCNIHSSPNNTNPIQATTQPLDAATMPWRGEDRRIPPAYRIEFATSDEELLHRLSTSVWLAGRQWSAPPWMRTVPQVFGDPSRIPERRLEDLRDDSRVPMTMDERRYTRNKAAIKQITADLGRQMEQARLAQNGAIQPTLAANARALPPSSCPGPTAVVSTGWYDLTTSQPLADGTIKPPAPKKAQSQESSQGPGFGINNTSRVTHQTPSLDTNDAPHRPNVSRASQDTHGERALALPALQSDTGKRKVSNLFQPSLDDSMNDHDAIMASAHLFDLANKISADLDIIVPNETIQLCGLAPIKLLDTQPDEVLELAHQKLHAWPYQNVPTCWRRLYEEASLGKAVHILRTQAELEAERSRTKKRRVGSGGFQEGLLVHTDNPKLTCSEDRDDNTRALTRRAVETDWVTEIVMVLDKALTISGAPGRASTFEAVFQQLEKHIAVDLTEELPHRFGLVHPQPLTTEHPIFRSATALNFEAFQGHLDKDSTPLIIPRTFAHWPAMQKWQDPNYFLRRTLGGRRLVPVEIGKSYTDADWGQEIISIGNYIKTYLVPTNPKEIGYLAQHDLFAQIPSLRKDIVFPDYCYTTPPEPTGAALQTPGLTTTPQLSEPMLNAWIGPKGTITPLHTDPYHNILCQVVGYKYIRLYAPTETPHLYPRGVDEKGVPMGNTAQVDISHVRPRSLGGTTDLDAVRGIREQFPEFEGAAFVEGVLAPGECLYIPLGWWHYVESLSVSVSVSFWWN
ncbi:hypothetical protein BDY17DRAFT_303607 [Neohortaea acidophila]|uniref:JmjC domain-containing protein n=1 Tax=Neohortaea acidophila TaxID=245834 RepID=A0A6A6PKW7_9PEZI|nr:uncharacterized protein BDY17DRAFT_303607 [Neohortaea acidophila]KAF2480304.1 hypothetical protein BDY17DRAFT_303607 [Neohortaea acidophila]